MTSPTDLKARIEAHRNAVDSIRVSSDLHASVRDGIASQLDGIALEADRDLAPGVRAAGDPALGDDLARLYRSMAMLNSWLEGRDSQGRAWIDRAVEFATSDVLRDMVQGEQVRLRDGEAFAGIRALCQQGLVDKARRQLVDRRKASADPVMKKRITEFLADPRNFLSPMKSAPAMITYNGVGTMLWGERDRKPDGSYIATLCIVLLFLPVIPLRSYLVARSQNGWTFYGRVPLSPFAFWWRRLAILGPLLLGLGAWSFEAYDSLPSVKEGRLLSTAAEQLDRRQYAFALRTLGPVAHSTDAGRRARMKELSSSAVSAALNAIQTPADASVFLSGAAPAVLALGKIDPAGSAAADAALSRIASKPDAAAVLRNYIPWMANASTELTDRKPELAARACESCDDPALLALTANLFVEARRPCPPALLKRLQAHLLKARHPSWDADAVSYLKAAAPEDVGPILLARVEIPWKGLRSAQELASVPNLPARLLQLVVADTEPAPEKKIDLLEKAADASRLAEPQRTWHRLGIARRLTRTYGQLNEKDPVRWPIDKALPWAVEAAELAPEDAEARVTALRTLIQQGEFGRAITLGNVPGLQDPRIPLLLGIATARSGKVDQAAALLRPLVERDFQAYITDMVELRKVTETKTENSWRALEKGTVDQSVLRRLNSLSQDQAQREAAKWVQDQVDRDPYIRSVAEKVKHFGDIHTAASELALVELELGQSLAKGPERQARLEAAEHLFVELRKILDNDPHQELQLGQVYFWLGKDKEGQEIYDKLEGQGDAALLHQMGEVYRNLGRHDAARRILELAFGKAEGTMKTDIAMTRGLTSTTSEDRHAWLLKCDQNSTRVKFELDQLEAEQNLEAGKYAAATMALQRVAEFYARLPERTMVFNNGSIVQLELASATGDLKYQMEALRLMRRAHESAPEDAIVLSNYVHDLQRVGIAALTGNILRTDLLHELPDWRWQDYAVPRTLPDALAVKAKSQPELRRSAELGAKSAVLSPDGQTGWQAQSFYYRACRDGAGLRRLREQLESRPSGRSKDGADVPADVKEEAQKKYLERTLQRLKTLLPELRTAGHAPTLAYALSTSAGTRMAAAKRKFGDQTFEDAIRDADESRSVFDCYATRYVATWVRMDTLAFRYLEKDPRFAAWVKGYPVEETGARLFFYLRKYPDRLAAFKELPGVSDATARVADLVRFQPDRTWVHGWIWLDLMGDDARTIAVRGLQESPTVLEQHRIDWLLDPKDFTEAATAWLTAEVVGDKELAARVEASVKESGILPLYFRD